MTDEESNLVANALRLNNLQVHEIMTPRTVMLALDQDLTVERVFRMHANVPFARIPLYRESIDHISGIVRRRDLHRAMVEETPDKLLKDLSQGGHFRTRKRIGRQGSQAFAFGALSTFDRCRRIWISRGVLAMEDIIESILGQEIFEHDDMAVDMREFAKRKHKARIKQKPKPSD